jgi:hypothetical protein
MDKALDPFEQGLSSNLILGRIRSTAMEAKKVSYAALLMLAGIILGAGVGTVLFASTGQIMFFTLSGAGAALGSIIGSGLDLNNLPPG